MQLTGGTGTFSVNLVGEACAVTWDTGFVDVARVTLASGGTFTNTVCGSGTWISPASSGEVLVDSLTQNAPTESLLKGLDGIQDFTINFTGFTGLLDFTNPAVDGEGAISIRHGGVQGSYLLNPASNYCMSEFDAAGSIHLALDDPAPPKLVAPMDPPPSDYPSQTCRAPGWTDVIPPISTGSGNAGGPPGDSRDTIYHLWAYVTQASPQRMAVCVRVQTNAGRAGGRLDVDTSGSPGVAPVLQTSDTDMTPCTLQGPHNDEGVTFSLATSPLGANPASVCVEANGTKKRLTVGTSGTAKVPAPTWTQDPDSAGPGPWT